MKTWTLKQRSFREGGRKNAPKAAVWCKRGTLPPPGRHWRGLQDNPCAPGRARSLSINTGTCITHVCKIIFMPAVIPCAHRVSDYPVNCVHWCKERIHIILFLTTVNIPPHPWFGKLGQWETIQQLLNSSQSDVDCHSKILLAFLTLFWGGNKDLQLHNSKHLGGTSNMKTHVNISNMEMLDIIWTQL